MEECICCACADILGGESRIDSNVKTCRVCDELSYVGFAEAQI